MALCEILIVDDDNDDVELLSEAFTESGVNCVHHVSSAIEAFDYLEGVEPEFLPKLIVADLYLPAVSGAEFLKELKGMDKYKHIYVIVLSTTGTDKENELFKALGANDYVIKPSSYEEYLRIAVCIKSRIML